MTSLQVNHRYLVRSGKQLDFYFEIEIIEESKNQFKIKTDVSTFWKSKRDCEIEYTIVVDMGLRPGLKTILPTIEQFNAIEDLRHYLHLHPNKQMVQKACSHFLEQNPI